MHKAPADLPWHEDTTSISRPQHAEPNASHAPATSISRPQHAKPNASHAPATSISRPQHAEPNASHAPATSISRPQHAKPNASHAPATSISRPQHAEPNASHAPATSISRPQHAKPNASHAPATSISRPQHAEPNASHAPATSIQNKTCGKRFCHFTQEGHQMVNGLLAPVFRVTRKRKRKVLTKADDVFLKDTIEAAAWCQLQTFTDHVSLPMVIGVEGAEQQALLAELKSVDRSCPEESPNRIEPFQFFFNSKKDYEMFCVEMFDRRKLKVFASWE
ncbi:unnamed protein product [Arctogadus glacialis]